MEIKITKPKELLFRDLSVGDLFMFDSINSVYMKIDKCYVNDDEIINTVVVFDTNNNCGGTFNTLDDETVIKVRFADQKVTLIQI